MQAKITSVGDCVIVHLIGRLDVETAGPFRRACLEHLTDKKVIFNFRDLSFVGSSGILPFLETMQDFARTNRRGLKFCGVGTEFKKILAATALSAIEVHENESLAASSFQRAGMTPEVPTTGIVAAPTMSAPVMPPMQPRVVTEGINPIFLDDAQASAADTDVDAHEDGSIAGQRTGADDNV